MLLVKLTSLGDVVHTFAALTDLAGARPEIEIDWLVDATLQDVARLHPAPRQVLPVGLRQWRGGLPGSLVRARPLALRRRLREARYDRVVDAQGLIKSAVLARLPGAPVVGFDAGSAREAIASRAYARCIAVPRDRHAVERSRDLLAAACDYPRPPGPPDFGLVRPPAPGRGGVLLLHGTTWSTKAWPPGHWRELAQALVAAGHRVSLPHAGERERQRAQRIAAGIAGVEVLPACPLGDMAARVANATAVVGVDSGLLHLAAAWGVPTVGIYGPTDPRRTGALGTSVANIGARLACAPCGRRTCSIEPGARGGAPWPPCLAAVTPATVAAAVSARVAA